MTRECPTVGALRKIEARAAAECLVLVEIESSNGAANISSLGSMSHVILSMMIFSISYASYSIVLLFNECERSLR